MKTLCEPVNGASMVCKLQGWKKLPPAFQLSYLECQASVGILPFSVRLQVFNAYFAPVFLCQISGFNFLSCDMPEHQLQHQNTHKCYMFRSLGCSEDMICFASAFKSSWSQSPVLHQAYSAKGTSTQKTNRFQV